MTRQPRHCWKPEAKHVAFGASILSPIPRQPCAQRLGRRQAFSSGSPRFQERRGSVSARPVLTRCLRLVADAAEAFFSVREAEAESPGASSLRGRFALASASRSHVWLLCVSSLVSLPLLVQGVVQLPCSVSFGCTAE